MDARNGIVFDITYDTGPCHLEGMVNVLAQDIELVEVASLNRMRDIVVALLTPLRVLQCGTPVPSGHQPSHFGLVFLDECACAHPFIIINLHWLLIMSNHFAFALCGHLTRLSSEGFFCGGSTRQRVLGIMDLSVIQPNAWLGAVTL